MRRVDPEDRMLEVGLAEIVGRDRVPDVRAVVAGRAEQIERRRRQRILWVNLITVAAGVTAFLVWPRPSDLQRLLNALARQTVATESRFEAYRSLLAHVEDQPTRWRELAAEIRDRLRLAPPPPLRSRLTEALAHGPPEVEAMLREQVADHGDGLDTAALLMLAKRGIGAADRTLEKRPPNEDALHLTWLASRGGPLDKLASWLERPASLDTPEPYFAAAVTLYQRGRFSAWRTCFRLASRRIRTIVRTDIDAAYRLTVMMFWFYQFLHDTEPFELQDLRRRAETAVRSFESPRPKLEEIATLLNKMR